MLRSCTSSAPRGVIASTSAWAGCSTRAAALIHTSAATRAEASQDARTIRRLNSERKAEKARLRAQNQPHVVLGTRPGENAKWLNCDLAKAILTPEIIDSGTGTPIASDAGTYFLPQNLAYGLDGGGLEQVRQDNVEFFFQALPRASATRGLMTRDPSKPDFVWKQHYGARQPLEVKKADMFARAVDLRNANAGGIAFENRRRVITAFSERENPYDPGRPEVQVALYTMRIRNVWDHMMRCKKDITSRRSLRRLIHQRAKMLKYIKKIDRTRYEIILQRCGIERESVEGELVV